MCGLCGIVTFDGEPVEPAVVAAMTETLRHRGPDDAGTYVEGGVGLGHRRLSIIDLSAAGHQPMISADGHRVLVFNGEIYNYRELRAELEGLGVRFRTASDTEVLLEGLGVWGLDVVPKLRGMFAFAEYDRRVGRVRLVRDRFGIKPCYYQWDGRALVFGSEIKALLASGRVPRAVDPRGLQEFMWFGNTIGTATCFQGVTKVPPGAWLEATAGGMAVHRYWSPDAVPPTTPSWPEAVEETRERLREAVLAHLVADVPVGVFLSGGIDSSAITAIARKAVGPGLRTYAVGFDDRTHADETGKARRVAEHFGTEHQEIRVSGTGSRDVLPRLVRAHDEPFGDAADIPLFLLAEQLIGVTKVVLQGDGGDEMFAGYRRYRILSAARRWRALGGMLGPALGLVDRSERVHRAVRFLRAVGARDMGTRMALLLTTEVEAEPPTDLLAASGQGSTPRVDPFAEYREAARRSVGRDPVSRMLAADAAILLPHTFLEKVDKATMAHGLEVRVPFLDPILATFAIGLPASFKVGPGGGKRVLKAALRGLVPDWVLDAPKTGFGVPYDEWLRGPLTGYWREVVLDPSSKRSGLLDHSRLERWMGEHLARKRNRGFPLWKALQVALWEREYLHAT